MVGRRDVVEHAQTIATLRLVQPVSPPPSVLRESQQEVSLVATMRDVPDQAGTENSIGASARCGIPTFLLCETAFNEIRACAHTDISQRHNHLRRSDPQSSSLGLRW